MHGWDPLIVIDCSRRGARGRGEPQWSRPGFRVQAAGVVRRTGGSGYNWIVLFDIILEYLLTIVYGSIVQYNQT